MTSQVESDDYGQAAGFGGLSVVAFESRMAAETAAMIRRRGGVATVAPSMREVALEDNHAAFDFARRLLAGEFDVVIFLTGVGVRELFRVIETRHPRASLVHALGAAVTLARGPKPVKALRDLGLAPTIAVAEPNTWREVLAELAGLAPPLTLAGKRVALQEYGVSNTELLEPYQPKEAAMILDAFKSNSAWIPYTGILNVFVVNTKKLKPEEYPKSWADLAQPRFKNLVSMADAEKSGSAYMQLNTFLAIYSDKAAGWDKFKGVFNNVSISTSSGAVPRFVNDGEAVVGITLEDNAYLYLKGGGPVAIVYPEDGTSAIADGMALCKRAPNPAAGKAFIDWALSAPVQEMVVQELGRRPIRKDAKPMAALKPMDQIKLVKYDIQNAANKRQEYIDKWRALMLAR